MDALEIATRAARSGANVLIKHWQHLGKEDADLKARNDWVSRADRESEQAILDFLQTECPGDACLAEEGIGGEPSPDAKRTWIIDPLDGTSNYLQHFPFWCISIALREDDKITTGVIYDPLRDDLFTAKKGAGAYRNGKRMQVSDQPRLDGAFLATGFPFRAQKYVTVYCAVFADVIRVVKGVRRAGSAALDLAYTAAGIFDGFFEIHLAPWDVAAGSLMVMEAGGLVSDFSGGQQFWQQGNIVGASRAVHRELLELIARHTSEDQLQR